MRKVIIAMTFILFTTCAFAQSDSLRMDSIIHTLPEVMVKGERPIVKVKNGELIYNLPQLISNKAVDNIYEAIKVLPGVTEINDALQLSGHEVTIIIDGKVTTMTAEQVTALLKSMPASRIANAEVMYNAPAKYQVRGTLININLKHEANKDKALQGEANLAWNQKHDAQFGERISLLYNSKHISADLMYLHSHGNEYSTTTEQSEHSQGDGSMHDISTQEISPKKNYKHDIRLGLDYNIAQDHQLSVVYNGTLGKSHSKEYTSGTINSDLRLDTRNTLHNLRLDYRTPFGMKAGAEYTYYKMPMTQYLNSMMPTEQLNYKEDNDQRINRWKLFVSQEHDLKKGWGINYGAVYTSSVDNSYQYYTKTDVKSAEVPADASSCQHENNTNIYAGFNKQFSSKLSMEASVAAEYYHSSAWHQWNIYPTFNLTYMPSNEQVFQLGLSSDKNFPEYWAVKNFINYSNGGYNEIMGNPLLKPSSKYQLQLVYVLKSKYQFVAWFSNTDDYIIQTPYQRQDRLTVVYKCLNLDFSQQAGVQASIPFRAGRWLQTNLTFTGVWQRDKDDDFYDLPFDRHVIFGMANLQNVIIVSTKPDITLNINGNIRSNAIQATYDLPASGSLDLSLRWQFLAKHAMVRLFCNDIMQTSVINPHIHYMNQKMTMDFSCYRMTGLSFTYKFGGYNEKKRENVDASRFRK